MIILIVLLICISATSCERGSKDESAEISGIVTDDVTGSPVEAANVGLIIQFINDGCQESWKISESTKTDKDGKYLYKYVYNKDEPIKFDIYTIYFPVRFSSHAWKDGYSGSSLHSLSDGDFENADIAMYRSAKISIHAKNERINLLDDIDIGIDRGPGFLIMARPEIIINCNGINYDKTFLVENLSANNSYHWALVKHNSNFRYLSIKSGDFIPKSDSIIELYIPY